MTLIKHATKVTLDGHGTLTLRASDYVTQGGEGAIYRKGKNIIKLYLDPKKMQRDDMSSKVRLLAGGLDHPSIVSPKGVVFNTKNKPIGYYMPFVNGEAFSRLFTNDFRSQCGFGEKESVIVASKMHEIVQFAHDQKALMVDANELNWLADIKKINDPTPYVIDVDSWEIDRWKASVIMPSIRDWHSSNISEMSDWFAWGVVSFLLFTGIHPYKGKLDGYKPGELERRMKDNASVFLPKVRLNKAVRDFKTIPGPLLDWYQATFTQGERVVPPSPLQTGKANTKLGRIMRVVSTTTGGLVYEKLFGLSGDKIVSVWPCGIVRTESGQLIEVKTKKVVGSVTGVRAAVVSRDDGWLIAEEIGETWQWRFISRKGKESELSVSLDVTAVVRSGGRLFAITKNELVELRVQQFQTPILTAHNRWQILGKATTWYQGVGISNVLGAMHVIAPFGDNSLAIVRTPELDGLQTVSAVSGNRFVETITINHEGEYQAYSFTFDVNWKKYSVNTRTLDSPEQNLTALPKGVVVSIPEDGQLIIAVPTQGIQKVVNDKDIGSDMQLGRIGEQVVYRKDGELWSLRMQ